MELSKSTKKKLQTYNLKKQIEIEWELDPEVEKYILEIEDEKGNIVLKSEETKSPVTVELPEGNYRYRVSSVNQVGKISSSNWEKLVIQKRLLEKPVEAVINKPEPLKVEPEPFCGVRWNYICRSAILPGWGQYYRKDNIYRVIAYPILYSILIPLYYQNYKLNQMEKNKYEFSINSLLISQNSLSTSQAAFGIYSYLEGVEARSKAKDTYTQGNHLFLIMAGLYIFNLMDASFLYDYYKPSTDLKINVSTSTRINANLSKENFYELNIKFDF